MNTKIFAVLLIFICSSFAYTNISACGEFTDIINTSGVYHINSSLTWNPSNSDSPCLIVNVSNVYIDGMGNTLIPTPSMGVGIYVMPYIDIITPASYTIGNVTITNVTINGTTSAIECTNANCTVSNSIIDSGTMGIYVETGSAVVGNNTILLDNSRGNKFHTYCSSLISGICLGNSTYYKEISNNTIDFTSYSTSNYPILLDTVSNVNITKNNISHSQGNLIYIMTSSNITVYDNQFNINTLYPAMRIYSSTGVNFNVTKTSATNIILGDNIGGNYWTNVNNLSEILLYDTDKDSIANSVYDVESTGTYYDYLPLSNSLAGFFTTHYNYQVVSTPTQTIQFNLTFAPIDNCTIEVAGTTYNGTVVDSHICEANVTLSYGSNDNVIGYAWISPGVPVQYHTNQTIVICYLTCSAGGYTPPVEEPVVEQQNQNIIDKITSSNTPVIASDIIENLAPNIIKSTVQTCRVEKTGVVEIFVCEYEGFLGLTLLDAISMGTILIVLSVVFFSILAEKILTTRNILKNITKVSLYASVATSFVVFGSISLLLVFINHIMIVKIASLAIGGNG